MRVDFKVYPRKIHVYHCLPFKGAPKYYAWSTNAYKTCREAVAGAKALYPSKEFTACFAKD